MLAFLRSRGDEIEHFTPVNYNLLPQWLDEKFFTKHKLFKGKRNPAIVVDFLYHPAAVFWFEHHPTTFKKPQWKKNFKPDKQHRLEPDYPSCCHLVYASLKQDFKWKSPKHIKDLVKWLDVSDGAIYTSAKQTILMKEPALQIDAYIDSTEHDHKKTVKLIELLSREPLARIAALPEVKRAATRVRKENIKGIAFYKKNIKLFKNGSFIDFTRTRIEAPHFIANYLYPKLLYVVRLSMRNGLYHLGVGASPWLRGKSRIHIGELLKKYGGGGHKEVGGVEFQRRDEAELASVEIMAVLGK